MKSDNVLVSYNGETNWVVERSQDGKSQLVWTVVGALGRVQRILCWLVLENRGQRTGAGEETLSPETQSVTYPVVPLSWLLHLPVM